MADLSAQPNLTDPAPLQDQPQWPARPFVRGWLLGALAFAAVRLLGGWLLTDPCQGHTALALLMPLLLGPGGLAYTASHWNDRPAAMFGLGLVVASLVPTLVVSTLDIGQLRREGCAGGYVMIAPEGGSNLGEITLSPGERRELTGRIGGYLPEVYPGTFRLEGVSQSPDVVVELPKTVVKAGEVFPLVVSAAQGAAINRFDWGVRATYQPLPGEPEVRSEAETSGKVSVTIVPRRQ